MMKMAQLVVTAIFAFLGGMTFQLLDGSTTAQGKGEKQDATHMKDLKVDSLSVKELRVYDTDWKDYPGQWNHDGIRLFGKSKTAASLTGDSISLMATSDEKVGGAFLAMLDNKGAPLVYLNGTNGKPSVTLGANVGDTNGAYVYVRDTDGAIRTAMAFSKQGKPLVATYDVAEKVVDAIGGK